MALYKTNKLYLVKPMCTTANVYDLKYKYNCMWHPTIMKVHENTYDDVVRLINNNTIVSDNQLLFTFMINLKI